MPDLVIELDRHEQDEQISSRPGRSRHAWIALGLTVVCVLTLGSGARPSPAVRLVADIKMHRAGELVALDGQILIDEPGTLTALDSRTARPRWRVQTGMERHLIQSEGDLVLVTGAAVPAIASPATRSAVPG